MISSHKSNTLGYKKFKTKNNCYIYDTYTNTIARVDEAVYNVIDNILYDDQQNYKKAGSDESSSATDAIWELVNRNDMFKSLPHNIEFEDITKPNDWMQRRKRLILKVTDDCNMRCKYCIYSDAFKHHYKPYNHKHMSLQTAMKAVDDYMHNSEGRAAINFYGGEPLLQYKLIEKLIEYINCNYQDRRVDCSITTNGTLLNINMIDFFYRNNVIIDLSIDGPKHIHDRFRKDIYGNDTHQTIIDVLKMAKNFDSEKFEKLFSFQATIYPDVMDVNSIINYFAQDELFLHTTVQINNMEIPENGFKYFEDTEIISNDNNWSEVLSYIDNYANYNPCNKTKILLHYYLPSLAIMYKRLCRPIDTSNRIPLNGCCRPGRSRLFVSTSGEYFICEKMGEYSWPIGDCDCGLDFSKTLKYINKYQTLSIDECRNCWAMHLCGLCYISAYDHKQRKLSTKMKARDCDIEKYHIKRKLIKLMEILEISPRFLQEYCENE